MYRRVNKCSAWTAPHNGSLFTFTGSLDIARWGRGILSNFGVRCTNARVLCPDVPISICTQPLWLCGSGRSKKLPRSCVCVLCTFQLFTCVPFFCTQTQARSGAQYEAFCALCRWGLLVLVTGLGEVFSVQSGVGRGVVVARCGGCESESEKLSIFERSLSLS